MVMVGKEDRRQGTGMGDPGYKFLSVNKTTGEVIQSVRIPTIN